MLWLIGLFPRFLQFKFLRVLIGSWLIWRHSDCTLLFIHSYHQVFLRRSRKRSLQWRSEEDSKLFTAHRIENRDPEKPHQQLKGEREVHQRVLCWAGGEATAWVSYLKSLFKLCESLKVFFVSELIRSTSSHDPARRVDSREEFLFLSNRSKIPIDSGLK